MTSIRLAEAKDVPAIENLLLTAFKTSAEADLVNKLRKTNFYDKELSFVAINEDKIVGYILFTRIVIKNEKRTVPGLILSTCAVTPDLQKQGIGNLLVTTGLKKCKYLGYKIVFSLGNDTYLKRFKFTVLDQYKLMSANEIKETPLAYLLNDDYKDLQGMIHYPIEFASKVN